MIKAIKKGDPEYVPPAPEDTPDEDLCNSEDKGYYCTLLANHAGRHVAHGALSIVAVWD